MVINDGEIQYTMSEFIYPYFYSLWDQPCQWMASTKYCIIWKKYSRKFVQIEFFQ